MQIKSILCPIDFSENSKVALDQATEQAAQHGAKLFIAHVEGVRQNARPGSSAYLAELDEYQRLLQEGRPYLTNIDFEQHYLRGDVVEEIIRFADARNVDRIVIGTHGRSGLRRVFLGSVAEAVSAAANCDVVTVPLNQPASVELSNQPFTSTYLI